MTLPCRSPNYPLNLRELSQEEDFSLFNRVNPRSPPRKIPPPRPRSLVCFFPPDQTCTRSHPVTRSPFHPITEGPLVTRTGFRLWRKISEESQDFSCLHPKLSWFLKDLIASMKECSRKLTSLGLGRRAPYFLERFSRSRFFCKIRKLSTI